MANGWIYLHRKLLDCSLWQGGEAYDRRSAWIDLLLLANHSNKTIVFDGHKMVIERGQYLTSIRKLSERWRWSKDRTVRYISLLEELEMIHRDSNTKRTLITIINYDVYQVSQDTNKDTDKDADKDADKDTDKPQTININKLNKLNKDSKRSSKSKKDRPEKHKHGEYQHVLLTDAEYQRLINDYGESRTLQAIKKVDEYCQQFGKSYKDYNLTLRKWGFSDDKPKGKNNFNNFTGRQYDAVELEKKLLGG